MRDHKTVEIYERSQGSREREREREMRDHKVI